MFYREHFPLEILAVLMVALLRSWLVNSVSTSFPISWSGHPDVFLGAPLIEQVCYGGNTSSELAIWGVMDPFFIRTFSWAQTCELSAFLSVLFKELTFREGCSENCTLAGSW